MALVVETGLVCSPKVEADDKTTHPAFIKTINKRIDISTLLDVRTYGDRLLIRRFIVVIYNSEIYTRAYY